MLDNIQSGGGGGWDEWYGVLTPIYIDFPVYVVKVYLRS
jgi:hypothetical protein